jgi:hypothetical protein
MHGSSRAGLLVLILAVACGGRTAGDTGDGDGDGDGDTTSTGDGDVCDAFFDEVSDETTPVRIANRGTRPVYVVGPHFCILEWFQIERDGAYWPPRDCDYTCAQMVDDGCACAGGCAQVPAIKLASDGVLTREWPGLMRVPDEISENCASEFCGFGACPQERLATVGEHVLTVLVSPTPAACDPEQGGEPQLCDCTLNPDGWCEVQMELDPASAEEFSAEFDVPVDGPIELVITP